jgi:hypothetical protein
MKTQTFSASTLTFTLLFAAASAGISARAGIISILRGDGAEQEQPAPVYQRVAFVGSAEVRAIEGKAVRLAGIDRWSPLRPGTVLSPGDIIRSDNGTVTLRMKESQSFVKVSPRTVLRLVPLERDWDSGIVSGQENRKGYLVRACRGKASVRDAQGHWVAISVDAVLADGTLIQTEPGTTVDLFNTEARRALRINGSVQVKLAPALLASRTLAQPALAVVSR